jgi:DNA primase
VYLVYDGDESGQTAALRGLELLENSELKIKIVPLPPDFDPDSFIDQQGKNSFLSLLERAYSIFDYRLERAMSGVEITQTEGKLKVVNEILPFLLRVENEIERSEYIKKVSHLLQIREADLIREVNKRKEKGEKTFQITPPSSLEYKIGTGLIKFALLNSEKIERLKEIDLEEFRDEKIKKIIQILIELFQQKVPLSPAKIMDYLPEEELRDFLSEVIIKGEEEKEEVFGDYLKKMKQIQLRRKIEKLKEEIARAENEKKAQQLIELLQKYRRWRLELNSLS